MTEYWLQKKTIGGWSIITWYDNKEQAEANYDKVRQNAGYSYRLVEVTTLQEHRLTEETVIEPPAIETVGNTNSLTKELAKVNPDTGWASNSKDWGNVNTKPDNNWGSGPSGELNETKHGMIGKVWLINHVTKERARVEPNNVASMLAAGWEKGGPKTQFRS